MFSYIKRHSVLVIIVLLVVVLTATGVIFSKKSNEESAENGSAKTVKVVPVGDFSSDTQTIQTSGTVESLEQAEIRSQFSAPVTKINVAIGDMVYKGQTLVTLQNADVAAQLDQALAGVKAQEAHLAELTKGARPEDLKVSSNDVDQADEAYKNALTNAVTTANNALVAAEDAVKNQAEPLFSDTSGKIIFSTSDLQAQTDAESLRVSVKAELVKWRADFSSVGSNPSEDQVLSLLSSSKTHGTSVKGYLSRVYDCLAGAYVTPQFNQATLTGYKTGINATRNSINTSLNALNGSEQGITAAKISVSRATDVFALKKAGYTDEQIKTQSAALDQARAAADALRAQFAKTIIVAPIDGKIASLPVRVGELVTVGQSVVSIINTKGLQVKAYISEDDFKRIEDGARVTIESNIEGTLMKVAPSLDTQTKKVEIKVLVVGEGNLIVGQDAKLSIPVKKSVGTTGVYYLPIQNVSIVPGNAYVYTVGTSSRIVAHPVILGDVRGDFIEVKQGITPDMNIVTPVYDLKEGDAVTVE